MSMSTIDQLGGKFICSIVNIFHAASIAKSTFAPEGYMFKGIAMGTSVYCITFVRVTTLHYFFYFLQYYGPD